MKDTTKDMKDKIEEIITYCVEWDSVDEKSAADKILALFNQHIDSKKDEIEKYINNNYYSSNFIIGLAQNIIDIIKE